MADKMNQYNGGGRAPSVDIESSMCESPHVEGKLLLPNSQAVSRPAPTLCGCMDDMETCCIGWWCPCLLFGMTLRRSGVTGSTCVGVAIYMALGIVLFLLMFAIMMWAMFPTLAALSDPACYCNATNGTAAASSWSTPPADMFDVDVTLTVDDNNSPDLSLRLLTELEDEGTEAAVQSPPGAVFCADGTPKPAHCWPLMSSDQGAKDGLNLYLVQVYSMNLLCIVLVGLFFGYFRRQVYKAIGAPPKTGCSSFWVHACGVTHACALCQEARAAKQATGGKCVQAVPVFTPVLPAGLSSASKKGQYGQIGEYV